MKKVYHLSTCSTCQRILQEIGEQKDMVLQDIKKEAITASQLEEMHNAAGSYESLFSRKAMKYRSMALNEMSLTEADYKKYILEEYTFLKRPVFLIEDQIFIGNSKKNIESLKEFLAE